MSEQIQATIGLLVISLFVLIVLVSNASHSSSIPDPAQCAPDYISGCN